AARMDPRYLAPSPADWTRPPSPLRTSLPDARARTRRDIGRTEAKGGVTRACVLRARNGTPGVRKGDPRCQAPGVALSPRSGVSRAADAGGAYPLASMRL